jgi:hypothetical protein
MSFIPQLVVNRPPQTYAGIRKSSISLINRNAGGNRVFLLQAEDHSGERAYYFVMAFPLRLPQFQKVIEQGVFFDIEEYGDIIASGYGEVPEDIYEKIRKEYGWEGSA